MPRDSYMVAACLLFSVARLVHYPVVTCVARLGQSSNYPLVAADNRRPPANPGIQTDIIAGAPVPGMQSDSPAEIVPIIS